MSYIRHTYHVIFSTKNRMKKLTPDITRDLYSYMGGIIRDNKGKSIIIGGTANHVHVLMNLHQSKSVSDVVRQLKGSSSRWINENRKMPSHFCWQTEYASFTVSLSMEEQVRKYITNQIEHHKTVSFKEEFIAFLKKHNVEYDDRYIFE